MRTVLLISDVGLDEGGGRAEKFATRKRMLEERGWDVVIGYVPRPYIALFPYAVLKCLAVGLRNDVDVVNSVSNPFHLQLIGYLTSLVLRVPWLVEFRDPMVDNPDRDPQAFLTRVAGRVERLAVLEGDAVVWGDGIQMEDDHLQRKYPDADPEKFLKLPFLGFESGLFEEAPATEYDASTVTYAGSFYEGWIEPYPLLEAVAAYVERNAVDADGLRLQFYGDWSDEYERTTEELGLDDVVATHDFVPHDDIVPVLKGSDVVVYIGGDDPENELSVPSKIWDYIGARTPILAIVDPTFRVARLIEEHGLGVAVDPNDPDGIAESLGALLSGDFVYDVDEEVYERFSRERKMDVLADVLDAVDAGEFPSATG